MSILYERDNHAIDGIPGTASPASAVNGGKKKHVCRGQKWSSTCSAKINISVWPMRVGLVFTEVDYMCLIASATAALLAWETSNTTSPGIDHSCIIWAADVYSPFSCLQSAQPVAFDVCCAPSQEASSTQTCLCSHANQTGWADHMPSEVTARKCSHRLRGLRLCRLRHHSSPSSSTGKQFVWYDSSA